MLAVAGGLWLALLVRRRASCRCRVLAIPFGLYVGSALAAVVFSQDPRVSVHELGGVLTLVLVPMTVTLLDVRRWDRLVVLLAVAATASSVVGLWQYLHGAADLGHRLRGLANHYMTFAGWTLIVVLVLIGDAAFTRDRRRLLWTVPAVLLCVTALVLSLTRGVWIGLAAGLVLAAVLRKPAALLALPVVAGLLAVALPTPVRARAVSIFDLDDPSNYDRLCMAEAGIEMLRDHPWFGVGLGMVKPSYQWYRVADAPRSRVPHLHNNVLQIAAERGLAGLAAYLAILAVFFTHAINALRRAAPALEPPLASSLIAIFGITVAGMFEYNWGDAEIWIPTLVLLAVPFALVPGGRV